MKDKAWTRATTVASTLADRYGLEKWAQRNTVLGLGLRSDLYAQAASCKAEDKEDLNRIADQAQEAAKAQSGANLGTALHRFTERIDAGEEVEVPDPWAADIGAYRSALTNGRIKVQPGWIERVVVVPILDVAGTLDRLVTVNGEGPYIADLKTGQDVVKYGMTEIALQLALYAGATHAWKAHTDDIRRDRWGRYLLPDPADDPEAYEPMPEVSRDRAVVIHLPAGKGECFLHWVDISAGREAVRKAMWVREWRKRKDLSTPLEKGVQVAANF
jgi:hypothetical protein